MAGNNSATSVPMIAMTTSSSTKVKPRCRRPKQIVQLFPIIDCPYKCVRSIFGMLMRMRMSAQCAVLRVCMFVRSVDRVHMIVAVLRLGHNRFEKNCRSHHIHRRPVSRIPRQMFDVDKSSWSSAPD